MKHLQTLVFLALLLFLSTACNPRKIVLSGEVDPRLFGDDSSWMYLYTVRINDYYIADSCQILNHRYRLTADLPEEELYRLLIPDAHAQLYLVLRPGGSSAGESGFNQRAKRVSGYSAVVCNNRSAFGDVYPSW